jgi:hypothetical protein
VLLLQELLLLPNVVELNMQHHWLFFYIFLYLYLRLLHRPWQPLRACQGGLHRAICSHHGNRLDCLDWAHGLWHSTQHRLLGSHLLPHFALPVILLTFLETFLAIQVHPCRIDTFMMNRPTQRAWAPSLLLRIVQGRLASKLSALVKVVSKAILYS